MKHSAEEIEAMRETLIVFGPNSETYYRKLSSKNVESEYDRFMKAGEAHGR